MQTKIDHLVIGAANLKQGVDYVRDCLGVEMPYGGAHQKMGTHNHLMQLGDEVFLEIIAINHEIEPPERPRWYGLDDPFIRRQIEMQPKLLTWVVSTENIIALRQRAMFSLGKIEPISRGDISWYFGLPGDGRLLGGGMLPYAIQWQTDRHPSERMADLGCRLRNLEIHHPYASWLQSALESIGATSQLKINALPKNEASYLKADITTPYGLKELTSRTMFDSALQRSGR